MPAYGTLDPVARKGENLEVWSQGQLMYYTVDFVEPLPAGSRSVIDFGSLTAGNKTQKAVQSLLQVDKDHLLQVRMFPIDDVEVELWQLSGNARFNEKNWFARVTRFTPFFDPDGRTTEFFVNGKDRDAQFVVNNPRSAALSSSRVMFWGFRYVLTPLPNKPERFTWIPAEARAA